MLLYMYSCQGLCCSMLHCQAKYNAAGARQYLVSAPTLSQQPMTILAELLPPSAKMWPLPFVLAAGMNPCQLARLCTVPQAGTAGHTVQVHADSVVVTTVLL
jgi:hypothetical protein